MIPLYFAPMNMLSNNSFRRLCLLHGADYVFTELIWLDGLLDGKEYIAKKLKIDDEYIDRTIIQVCAKNTELIEEGIKKIKEMHPKIKEINYNMGCPQSTLSKNFIAGGILNSIEEMDKVSKTFSEACKDNNIKPSIKLRLGPRPEKIIIDDYLNTLSKNNIAKFYIHARTLRHSYHIPAIPKRLADIKKRFPDSEIIYNGDITDYEDYRKATDITNPDGIMIGRKALEDPRVFNNIKQKKEPMKQNQFPIEEKKEFISEFLDIAEKDDLDFNLVKMNLNYLTGELYQGNKLRKEINDSKEFEDIRIRFI